MISVALVTTDISVVPQVKEVVDLLQGGLIVKDSAEGLAGTQFDLIFWYSQPFNEHHYLALKELSPRVVWLMDRKYMNMKLGPGFTEHPRPPFSIWFPFLDVEEIYYLLTQSWNGF
jgi:hypothetical protein